MGARAMTALATVQAWSAVTTGNTTVLQRCIDAASELLERWCGRRFASTAYTNSYHSGLFARGCSLWLADPATGLATPNVTAVSSVVEDGTTLSTVLAGTAYTSGTGALCIGRTGELIRVSVNGSSLSRTAWAAAEANILASYTAGFTSAASTSSYTMPLELEHACCELSWLLFREQNRVGLDNIQAAGRSAGLRGALSPISADAVDAWTVQVMRSTLAG